MSGRRQVVAEGSAGVPPHRVAACGKCASPAARQQLAASTCVDQPAWPAPLPAVLSQQMQLFLHLLPWLRSVLRAAPHPAPHAARLPADGVSIDGRRIKVDWATRKDFEFFGWKWTENAPSRSPSRSPSRCVDGGHPWWFALQLAPAQRALLCQFAGVGGASAQTGTLPNALACASLAALLDAAALMKHSCCAMQGLQGALPFPAAIPLPGRQGRLLLKKAR